MAADLPAGREGAREPHRKPRWRSANRRVCGSSASALVNSCTDPGVSRMPMVAEDIDKGHGILVLRPPQLRPSPAP